MPTAGVPSKPQAPPLPPKPKVPPLPPKPKTPPSRPSQPSQPPQLAPQPPPLTSPDEDAGAIPEAIATPTSKRDRADEDSGKRAEAAREAQTRAEETVLKAADAERERQQAVKAEARAMAEAAERKTRGSAAAAINKEEQDVQQQVTGAAASEVAAQGENTAELESGDEIGEEADGDDDAYEDPEIPTESEEDYVEPHIDVPGIPYMAADAQGGSHMEECHRVRSRTARSRLEKFFWPGEHKHAPTGPTSTIDVAGQTI